MRPPACAVKFELSSIFRSGRKHPSVMMVRCKHQLWPPPFGYNFIQKSVSLNRLTPPIRRWKVKQQVAHFTGNKHRACRSRINCIDWSFPAAWNTKLQPQLKPAVDF